MKCVHNLQENVLGTILWDRPITIQVVWGPSENATFIGVQKTEVMKTGCYVFHLRDGRVVVLPPGYRFLIEQDTVQ